jgi:hypothetical protein
MLRHKKAGRAKGIYRKRNVELKLLIRAFFFIKTGSKVLAFKVFQQESNLHDKSVH